MLCNSDVLLGVRGSNFTAHSIASISSLRRLVNKNRGEQNVCPPVLCKVRTTESGPSRLTWTPWIAAATQKLHFALHRQARPTNQPRKNNLRFQLHEKRRQRQTSPLAINTESRLTPVMILWEDKKHRSAEKRSRRCGHRSLRTTERQERKRLSRRPTCSDTIEETSSDDIVALKKRTRSHRESQYFSSTLFGLHTCDLSHAHIQSVHGWWWAISTQL